MKPKNCSKNISIIFNCKLCLKNIQFSKLRAKG